jgi:hypothetical protein
VKLRPRYLAALVVVTGCGRIEFDEQDSVTFDYPDFGARCLILNGVATCGDGVIHLVTNTYQRSAVYAPCRIPFGPDTAFSIALTFSIAVVTADPADGLAVVVHDDPRGTAAVGIGGGSLGIGQIAPSVAVGFDCHYNVELADPADTFIAIRRDGVIAAPDVWTAPTTSFLSGSPTHVWIDYDARAHLLETRSSTLDVRPDQPELETQVDLATAFGGGMYVGVTSSSGAEYAPTDLHALSLAIAPARSRRRALWSSLRTSS